MLTTRALYTDCVLGVESTHESVNVDKIYIGFDEIIHKRPSFVI